MSSINVSLSHEHLTRSRLNMLKTPLLAHAEQQLPAWTAVVPQSLQRHHTASNVILSKRVNFPPDKADAGREGGEEGMQAVL